MVKMRQRHTCVFEFEQGSAGEILAYIQYNADFMHDRLFAFHTDITPEIYELLHKLGSIPFVVENKKLLQQSKEKELLDERPKAQHSQNQEPATQKIKITLDSSDLAHVVMETIANKMEYLSEANALNEDSSDSKQTHNAISLDNEISSCEKNMPMQTFNRIIRSGEEISLESHAVFTKDINAGAFIRSSGNLHIYGKCNGVLECFGDYIIMGEFAMGRISLQNINLEGKMLEAVKSSKKLKMLTIENGAISISEL